MLAFVFADFVDGHDVRMVEVGGGLGFGMKTLHIGRRSQLARQDHLQGHDAVQADLPSFVHHAHAATGDFLQQFVIAEIAHRGPSRRGTGCRLGCCDGRKHSGSKSGEFKTADVVGTGRTGPDRLERLRPLVEDRLVEETPLRFMGCEQRLDPVPESQVASTGLVQVSQAFGGGFLQGSDEHDFDTFRVRVHDTAPKGSWLQRLTGQCVAGRRHASP